MREKQYKRCPRCNRKMHVLATKCDTCNLVFDRLKNVTNKAGKQAIRDKEYNKVVYVKDPPRDVNKWKLLLITIFLGLVGVHYFKIGRTRMGIIMCVSLFLFLFYGLSLYYNLIPDYILYDIYLGLIINFLAMPEAVCVIIWVASIFGVIANKFKYPVSIDEEYAVDTIVAKEILSDVKKEREKQKIEKTHKNQVKNRKK